MLYFPKLYNYIGLRCLQLVNVCTAYSVVFPTFSVTASKADCIPNFQFNDVASL